MRTGIWTDAEARRILLADDLKAMVTESSPLRGNVTVYADMLNAALSEVRWTEIAAACLDSSEATVGK